MIVLRAESIDDTHAIAAAVARLARPGDVIALVGDLGAGKTAFAQGFGAALGVTEPITSPTFTLVHSYDAGDLTLHHVDLYRLERTGEIADLALAELAEGDGIVLVEWGEVLGGMAGGHLAVVIEAEPPPTDPTVEPARIIELHGEGPAWAARWARLEAATAAWRC
ncbi:MAG: tRNA (adenosine(37)-N6)-threonylcarbamoyltransferase complex ATPase subunit type 1 TsaE [Ilumatobacteraceae bacterium]|jgi:tRNA threonylcarbamoyladenosine biosynthesis protein TsaE|nr:tRNA (adenosine(37)-N6)-threonylcarbamoyltransferase complex ATPase subunit type 1 TsaE [Ilumatobacteraceae bacterium]